jgi:hypothetical protein
MKNSVAASAAIAAFLVASAAHAYEVEWRLTGPSFSHHFGDRGAVTSVKHGYLPNPCTAPPGAACINDPIHVLVKERARFQENNPSIGLELTLRGAEHADKIGISYTRDSYDTPSLMLSAGRVWPLVTAGTFAVEGGLVAGLWHRSVLNRAGDDTERRTVPFVLPVLSVTEASTGLGFNLALAPAVRINGRTVNNQAALMFQTTWLLSSKSTDKPSVLDTDFDGSKWSINYRSAW